MNKTQTEEHDLNANRRIETQMIENEKNANSRVWEKRKSQNRIKTQSPLLAYFTTTSRR